MKRSARSAMAAGVSMMAVSAAVIAPVHPTDVPASVPTVRLTAAVEPLQPGAEPPHIPALLRSSGLLPSVVPTALPGAPSVLAVPIAPNLANNIDNLYVAVEPWVQYGFEVAAAAIAWVPYVGFLSGLIMDGYFFGEGIVASAVFNFTDFLRGDGGLVENLVDFGVDVGLAFVWLGLDVVSTFIPLPPCNCYPPRPPLQGPGPFLALDALTTLRQPAQDETADVTFVDESAQPALDETIGKEVDGVDNGIEQKLPAPAKKVRELVGELVGELVDRFTGELPNGGEEGLDNVENAAAPSGTVRAQGQVRSSVIATPSNDKTETGPRGGKLNEKLAKLAQSLSPKKPTSTDDGAGDQGAGDTSGTQ